MAESFTIDHFRDWTRDLVLDNGEPWILEDFQAQIVADIFSRKPEVWVLIPEGNAKTTLMAGIGLYYAAHTERARIPLAAASREQAGMLFGQAVEFVIRSDIGGVGGRVQVKNGFRITEGVRKIEHMGTGSRLQIFAADDRTGDGSIFNLALIDELHRHRDLSYYRILRGKLDKRPGSQIVTISTAGAPGSDFEATREAMRNAGTPERNGKHLRIEGPDTVLHEWALAPEDDFENFDLVKQANPLNSITVEKLRRRHSSPSMRPAHWARFVCNVATTEEGSWLPAGAWDGCCDPGAQILDGAPVWVGVDVGVKRDKTAVVLIHYAQDDRVDVRATIFDPPDGGELDLGIVEQHIRDLAERYEVLGVAYDPWSFTRSAQLLEADGLLMVNCPMTNARMVPASQRLYEAIVGKRLRHDGDPALTQHVLAGTSHQTERGWRLGKRKARNPQDALIALCLAFGVADIQEDQGAPVLEWIA